MRAVTQHEFNHIVAVVGTLSPEQMRRLRHELDAKLAMATRTPAGTSLGSLGAMRDAADELDQIVE